MLADIYCMKHTSPGKNNPSIFQNLDKKFRQRVLIFQLTILRPTILHTLSVIAYIMDCCVVGKVATVGPSHSTGHIRPALPLLESHKHNATTTNR